MKTDHAPGLAQMMIPRHSAFSWLLFVVVMSSVAAIAQDAPVAPRSSMETPAEPAPGAESVSELQQLVNLPLTATIGKEYMEDPKAVTTIFKDDETIKRIFGKAPPFIYFPEGVDPMIIPWIREKIKAEEMLEDAKIALANKDFDKSVALLKRLQEELPNTVEGQGAASEIARVNKAKEDSLVAATPKGEEELPESPIISEPVLPKWVSDNTTGVLISPVPQVLVGNDFLGVGDSVPRFRGVTVKAIRNAEVVYLFNQKEFTLQVDGSF